MYIAQQGLSITLFLLERLKRNAKMMRWKLEIAQTEFHLLRAFSRTFSLKVFIQRTLMRQVHKKCALITQSTLAGTAQVYVSW